MADKIPNDNVILPASWRGTAPILAAVGAICILVSVGLFYLTSENPAKGMQAFFHSYLANYMYSLSFCLGALFFVMVQHLARASWSASVRRIAELLAYTIPWWAALFIPILAMVLFSKSPSLYAWNSADRSLVEPVVAEKFAYLNSQFYSIRTAVYFAVFIIASTVYFRMSRKQDETGDVNITLKLQRWAGPFIMLFALAVNFAAFDWMMSTDAAWFSTIYGVYIFAAGMLSFFAVMILLCYLLQRSGRVEKLITVEHYHDLSKFMFGFVVFWAYIAFSQFLLYWYGNIPEETLWYMHRGQHGWFEWGIVLVVIHFVIPFLGTISRHVRRRPAVMAGWAVYILFVHWFDFTYLIMPNVGGLSVMLIVCHLVCWIGLTSLFAALFLWRVGDKPVVALRDPWLPESLAYHNV